MESILWVLLQPATGLAIITALALASLISGIALIVKTHNFYRD